MNEPITTQNTSSKQDVEFDRAVEFLQVIGIPVYFRSLEEDCFLPGVRIEGSCLVVDREKLKFPGDILHEAGHIAVVPAAERKTLTETSIANRPMREAEEMMAIAWSYAACVHLGFDAKFVFHDHGYKNGGSSIAENFSRGHYFGVPMLQWTGMALEKKNENDPALPVYPAMLKWLRD
ncbi:MAG: hypothetical protein ACO25B_11490 [Chitinophagaceae bacterium]